MTFDATGLGQLVRQVNRVIYASEVGRMRWLPPVAVPTGEAGPGYFMLVMGEFDGRLVGVAQNCSQGVPENDDLLLSVENRYLLFLDGSPEEMCAAIGRVHDAAPALPPHLTLIRGVGTRTPDPRDRNERAVYNMHLQRVIRELFRSASENGTAFRGTPEARRVATLLAR